jgi:hypothetical protein
MVSITREGRSEMIGAFPVSPPKNSRERKRILLLLRRIVASATERMPFH